MLKDSYLSDFQQNCCDKVELITDGFIRCAEKQRVIFYGKWSTKSLRGEDSASKERLHGQADDRTKSTREYRKVGEADIKT